MNNSALILRQAGLRVTAPRLVLLGWLQQHAQPISVENLWAKMKKSGIDRVTIYRVLEMLKSAGLARSVDLGHGHAHYEYNDPAKHHHHLVCESCGQVIDITVHDEGKMIRAATRRHKFSPNSHSFEVFGLCQNCQ